MVLRCSCFCLTQCVCFLFDCNRYRARLNEILAAMKSPYLEIQELANNVVRVLSIVAAYISTLHEMRFSDLDSNFHIQIRVFLSLIHTYDHPFQPPQAQQEFPQDVYSDAPSEADLEALYDALRRQREGLEYITDILT